VTADTIPARLFHNAERTPGKAAYYERSGDEWVSTSWSGYADQVRRAGKALMALGVKPGQHVTILGFNRPEWVVVDLAAMAIGGAPAGIYITSSKEEVRYINEHSEAPVTLVENQMQLDKIMAERDAVRRFSGS
jgi:long-chain acyl-CoA synthetase